MKTRKHKRLKISEDISYDILSPEIRFSKGNIGLKGKTFDISEAGLRIQVSHWLPIDCMIRIHLPFLKLYTEAKITNHKPRDTRKCLLGMKFIDLTPLQKRTIKNYIGGGNENNMGSG